MKIVFSTDQIYLHGGIEKVMAEKANYFAEVLNYEVIILTTEQKNNPICYQLSSKIKLIDIGVNYKREISYFHPNNLLKIPNHFIQWRKTLKELKPNVVIACNYAFDYYWIPFFFKKTKKIKEYHSSRYFEEIVRKKAVFFKKVKYLVNDFIESKYDNIIILNKDEQPFYRSKNTVVIPNPINLTTIKCDLIAPKAIAAGRIAPVKGFENIINAWAKVVIQKADWKLDIYGQGDENYLLTLKEKVKKLKMENHIFFKPATSNLLETMTNYSMYLMTSHTECFPMVLLESLSVGLPVISFDCPYGPRNIITHNEDGFLVENQNIDELARKVIELIENPNKIRTFGENAKKNSSKFSVQVVMQKWITVLNS